MSERQSRDELRNERKEERKKRREQRAEAKREKQLKEEELKEQERIDQERKEQDKQQQNEERPTTSGSTKPKNKKRRRVYYSAVSGTEDDAPKFFDAKSSFEDFQDSISRTDYESAASLTVAKKKDTPKARLQPIPEDFKDLPQTSKAMPTKKKDEKIEEEAPKEAEVEAPRKSEEKPKVVPVSLDKTKAQRFSDETERKPRRSDESRKINRGTLDNDGKEPARPPRDSKSKTSEKLPKVIPVLPQASSSEQYPQAKKSEFEKFKELTDNDNDDDSEDYEIYIEKMKAKRKKMSKTTGSHKNEPAEPWSYGERTYIGQGGAFVYMVIPPDGGFGWLVLLVSFLCQVIVDGIVLSLGIVLPFIAEDMGSSPSTTSLVASTQIGPITSAFINKYGFRPVALFGGITAICTILIATLSSNLAMLIVFYSVFGGMSLSMIWSSSQLIVGYYFEKYRPIASGISCSGAGAGVLMFSYMNSQLAPQVGWRNTTRIHVLFLVFVLLIVLCYVEVEPTRIGRMLDYNLPDTDTDSDEYGVHTLLYSRITLHEPQRQSMGLEGSVLVQYERRSLREVSNLNKCFQWFCPPFRRFMEKRQRDTERDVDTKRVVIRQDPLERQDIYYTGTTDYGDVKLKSVNEILSEKELDIEIEMLPSGNQRTQSIHYNLSRRHVASASKHSLYSQDDRKARKGSNAFLDFISPSNWIHPKIKRAFNLLFDLRLLAIMEFQVLLASAFFFPMGFNIPFVYSKVRAELDPYYTNLISPAIGISNFILRITSGVVAFKFRAYTVYICGYGIVFGGAITLLSSMYGKDVIWFQFLYAVCFAVAPAFYSTLRAIIYVQMLGLDKLTNAFGLTAMAMGAGVFIGTFIGGLLIELTGGYVATFAFSGSCMILAGSLKLILPTLRKNKKRKRTRFSDPEKK